MNFARALKRIAGGYAQVGTAERIAGHAGIGRSPVNDQAYTILQTDVYVALTAITAARTIALPSAASYPPGQPLDIGDESGKVSGTLTVGLTPNGSDTINTAAVSLVFSAPFFRTRLFSDGVSNWSTGVVSVAGGGTGTGTAGGGALDNILGIAGQAGAGFLLRTAAAAYSFVASSTLLQAANNLSDLQSASTARSNLGLGNAATKSVGTATGTVAAGDDSRFGATAFNVTSKIAKSAAFTASDGNGTLYDLTGSFAATLPAASGASASAPLWRHFRKRDGSGVCTLALTGSDTWEDGTTAAKSLYQEACTVYSLGGGVWAFAPGTRQRGWVDFGAFSVTSGTASVTVTAGAGDAEIRDAGLDFFNYVPSASGSAALTINQGGTA